MNPKGPPVEAFVQTGRVVTPYLRGGYGPAVVLLRDCWTHHGVDPLFRLLSGAFKVTWPALAFRTGADPASWPGLAHPAGREPAPQPGPTRHAGADPATWLAGVMDGLGLDRPAVVAEAGLESDLIQFLATDVGRVGRVAFLARGTSEELKGAAMKDTPPTLRAPGGAAPDPLPLIVVPALPEGLPHPAARGHLLRFLAAG